MEKIFPGVWLGLRLLLFFFSNVLCGQNTFVDSLKNELSKANLDTVKCNILAQLAETADDNEWPAFNKELLVFAESKLKSKQSAALTLFYKRHLASALNNVGYLAMHHGENDNALVNYNTGLSLFKEVNDKNGIANALNNIGNIYDNQGAINKALEYYYESLKYQEASNNKIGAATALNNIGFVYANQHDYDKALEYYKKSLVIREEIQDNKGIARSLNNIAGIYYDKGDIFNALQNYRRSLELREKIGDRIGISRSLNNIGSIYENYGDPDCKDHNESCKMKGKQTALEFYNRSLKIQTDINDKEGLSLSHCKIGGVYMQLAAYSAPANNLKIALMHGEKSMLLAKEIGYPQNIRDAAQLLSEVYEKQKKGMESLKFFKIYIRMRDSIANEETQRSSLKKQFQYDYDKKSAADSVVFAKKQELKNAQIAKQDAELKAKRNQQYLLFGGVTLLLVFAGFMYNRFRVTQKQKKIIEEQKLLVEKQKHVVEEKQSEILDSIRYAKRIQSALVTSEYYITKELKRLNRKK